MKVNSNKGKEISFAVVKAIQENKDYLSEIDGLIGDGDHGINMNKGFTMYEAKAKDQELDLAAAFKMLGRTLLADIGGSMGPLYGTFFIEMSKQAKGAEYIDAELFGKMLNAALTGVQSLGNAQVGDKTLVDCIAPSAASYNEAIEAGDDFKTALEKMKAAAVAGRDSTKELVAKLGRASRLGERSRGVLDAGASSCCVILCAIADKLAELAE